MLLNEYLDDIETFINDFVEAGIIISFEVATDFRTDKIGLIKGSLTFVDNSILYFKEYLDLRFGIRKYTYSYHYQENNAALRFRYDNASHKPDPGF